MLEEYNKDDLTLQKKSVEKLMKFDFVRLIPGHQRRYEFSDVHEKNAAIQKFLDSH